MEHQEAQHHYLVKSNQNCNEIVFHVQRMDKIKKKISKIPSVVKDLKKTTYHTLGGWGDVK